MAIARRSSRAGKRIDDERDENDRIKGSARRTIASSRQYDFYAAPIRAIHPFPHARSVSRSTFVADRFMEHTHGGLDIKVSYGPASDLSSRALLRDIERMKPRFEKKERRRVSSGVTDWSESVDRDLFAIDASLSRRWNKLEENEKSPLAPHR